MTTILGVLVLLALGVFVLGGLALLLITERSGRKAEENAPALLDRAFDGLPQVTYKVNMKTPSYETVLRGAEARGYRLVHEINNSSDGFAKTLLFDRA
ncbi:hypothetical protein [Ornithinimicrobium murale]|uniref:hypothetical protein n=1 Tax=Ornithinimicrobium murale TaxID=1050153 RepID=UPI000E0DA7BA|nr:hypothetical protein [Ornithinimicrobium murale]